MMGSYIIVAVGLPPEGTGIDVLLLVDWQNGCVTIVCRYFLVENQADVCPASQHPNTKLSHGLTRPV